MNAGESGTNRWFWIWLGKGLVTPVLIWILLGAGAWPGLPPLFGPTGGSMTRSILESSGVGMICISSYWAGLTLAWWIANLIPHIPEENRASMRGVIGIWGLPGLVLGGWIVWAGGWGWLGLGLVFWLLPVAHGLIPLRVFVRPQPHYTMAVASLKFGKYAEAEQVVIQELEKCEDDFQGWMMLAELYANHFDDLPGAAATVYALIDQPNVNASNASVALHRLADWHLQLGEDPAAARQALEEISRRFPGSHLDKMARQRINRLPESVEALREQRHPRPIRLNRCEDVTVLEPDASEVGLTESEAAARAERYVRELEADPDDAETRERFARLLAGTLQQPHLAIEQLELLVGIPNQPAGRIARWLSLMADWYQRRLEEPERARQTLQRIADRYPGTQFAFDAQRRVALLDAESKWRVRRVTR